MTPILIAGFRGEIDRYCVRRHLDTRRVVTLTPQSPDVQERLQGFAAGTEIVMLAGAHRVPDLLEMIRVRGMTTVYTDA